MPISKSKTGNQKYQISYFPVKENTHVIIHKLSDNQYR